MFFPFFDLSLFRQPVDAPFAALLAVIVVGIALVTARRPLLGPAALLLIDPFDSTRYIGYTAVTLPQAALLGASAGLVYHFARSCPPRHRFRDVAKARLLIAALVALAAANAVSLLQADYWWAWRDEMVKLRDDAAFFFIALAAGIADDDIRPIEFASAAIVAIVSAVAFRDESIRTASVVAISGALIPRIAGPLEGPNQLAGYLQVLIPTLAALALARGPRPSHLLVLGTAAAADVLTLSRNGLVCGTVATAIVLFFATGERLRVAGALGFGAACAFAVQPQAWFRYSSTSEVANGGGVGTRRILWRAAFELWRRHPIFGVGAGNFEFEIRRVGPAGVQTHANDWYIQSLVEGGIPLAAATLFTVYASIVSFADDCRKDPLVLSALAVSIGLAIASVLDYVLYYPKVEDMWWLLLGLASARRIRKDSQASA